MEELTGYVFLALAIGAEVVATTFLKFASGENPRWWAFVIVIAGYIASFFALSVSLRGGVPLGIAYAIWSGAGTVIVVVVSWLLFKESLTWVQIGGMVLVVLGVGLLELGGKH